MSQNSIGIKSLLASPLVYNFFQNFMGASWIRQEFIDEFVKPGENCTLLDVGCGTAEILECLPNSVSYWGYDISEAYIEAAKKRYKDRGVFVVNTIDQNSIGLLPKFDIILLIGVLHHLDDTEVQQLFSLLKESLNTGGRILTMDPCFDDFQNPIARFLIQRDRGCNVRDLIGYKNLLAPIFPGVSAFIRHRKWVPYTHCIMECINDTV